MILTPSPETRDHLIIEGRRVRCLGYHDGTDRSLDQLHTQHWGSIPLPTTFSNERGRVVEHARLERLKNDWNNYGLNYWTKVEDALYLSRTDGPWKILGEGPLKADWFTGGLIVAIGECIKHSRTRPIYDVHRIYTFEKGDLRRIDDFPGEAIIAKEEERLRCEEAEAQARRAPPSNRWKRKAIEIMKMPPPGTSPWKLWLLAIARRILLRWNIVES